MSRHVTACGYELRLGRASVPAQYWVRLATTGRTLGCVFKDRSKWCWATTRNAYRGDGRPASATDGIGDQVPAHLDALGKVRTLQGACTALVIHLHTTKAPVLGFGPHPDVHPLEAAS